MARRNKTGRIFSFKFNLFYRGFARCASVALSTAFLQLPAFLSSCVQLPLESAEGPTRRSFRINAPPGSAQTLDVFFFDTLGARNLDAYQQLNHSGDSTLYTLSGAGARQLVVLSGRNGDTERWMGIRTYGQLCKHTFQLDQEDPAAPLLAGEMMLPAGASRRADVQLRPCLAAIRIRSVSCDFSGRPYAGSAFVLNKLFLTYAGAECHPLGTGDGCPVSWLNPGLLDSAAVLCLPQPEMVLQPGCGAIGTERVTLDQTFYCYPHPLTCLVLEGQVDDITCYYPIPLPMLEGGAVVEMDLTLRRMGSPSPDIPTESGAAVLETLTHPWEAFPESTVRF